MGVTKEVLRDGAGASPTKGKTVTVHCTGYGKDNDISKKFWSTKDPGQEPFSFKVGLGQVIRGWDEGVAGMKVGEIARLTCTPDYAYGAGGFPAWGYPLQHPKVYNVPTKFLPEVMARLPLDMDVCVSAPNITDENYWKRCCKHNSNWKNLQIQDHGLTWKQMYLEKHLQDLLEGFDANADDIDRLIDIVKACQEFIFTLEIDQLLSHLDLNEICAHLKNLTRLRLTYGVKSIGMKYERMLFGMKISDATNLSHIVKNTKTLTSLWLPSNLLDDDLLRMLMTGLVKNTTITSLDLSHNKITNHGARLLAKLLGPDSVLTSINLCDNQIHAEGGRYLSRGLKYNTSIVELNLRLNRLTDEALERGTYRDPLQQSHASHARNEMNATPECPAGDRVPPLATPPPPPPGQSVVARYERWVQQHSSLARHLESMLYIAPQFVPKSVSDPEVSAQAGYSLVGLLGLYHDYILYKASPAEVTTIGNSITRLVRVPLSVVTQIQVLAEVVARKYGGEASRWRLKRILETNIVEGAENQLMRWVGRGSATQMYCAIIFAGKLVYEADAAANIYEVLATSGAIASASACVFFGAKLMCDKIVTDIASCRNFGEKNEFVKLTVQGALAKYALCVSPEDIRLMDQNKPDVYNFQVGERNFSVDLSKGKCLNRKALETLLQGKPLVTRKGKHPKRKTGGILSASASSSSSSSSASTTFPVIRPLSATNTTTATSPNISITTINMNATATVSSVPSLLPHSRKRKIIVDPIADKKRHRKWTELEYEEMLEEATLLREELELLRTLAQIEELMASTEDLTEQQVREMCQQMIAMMQYLCQCHYDHFALIDMQDQLRECRDRFMRFICQYATMIGLYR
ncbi:hypothetical protein ATCC90586_002379 [Pythium insidiosum]|nr:hypothetical protein ATCC90586_002379 [Pythium insidiosum]